jgi:hypothetical protein
MEPIALITSAHDQQVALARHEHHITVELPGWGAINERCIANSLAKHKWPPHAQHDDGDERVVQPAHFTIAMQPLKVCAVSIQNGSDSIEPDSIGRCEMHVGLPESGGAAVRSNEPTESFSGDVTVVAQHLSLLPRNGFVYFVEECRGVGNKAGGKRQPRATIAQVDALGRCLSIDGQRWRC